MTSKIKYKKAIILGGTSGIGKAISKSIRSICAEIFPCSRKDIDTSDLESVNNFIKRHKSTDVLLLNSGGPPAVDFNKITKAQWDKYHNQLFYSFCLILQKMKINKGGYIFYISSLTIKQPSSKLIISTAYRTAFSSVIKSLSHDFLKKNISIINIAPGSFLTPRTLELVGKRNIKKIEKSLPTKKIADPMEIGKFVEYILVNRITQLAGNTIFFDGSQSRYLF